jgi:hypothetical protein
MALDAVIVDVVGVDVGRRGAEDNYHGCSGPGSIWYCRKGWEQCRANPPVDNCYPSHPFSSQNKFPERFLCASLGGKSVNPVKCSDQIMFVGSTAPDHMLTYGLRVRSRTPL